VGGGGGAPIAGAHLPLERVADVDLPGRPNRFDYQDIDATHGLLVIAHMSDSSVVVASLADGSVRKVLPNIPTARGVIAAPEANRFFVTSSPNQLVIVDATTLAEMARVPTGNAPDGVGWDPVHSIVGVSDQRDGAVSLIADAGTGKRVQVPVGVETGNVVFDPKRRTFWVTVVTPMPPDQLVEIDPVTAAVKTRIDLPGCDGAHGLRVAPDEDRRGAGRARDRSGARMGLRRGGERRSDRVRHEQARCRRDRSREPRAAHTLGRGRSRHAPRFLPAHGRRERHARAPHHAPRRDVTGCSLPLARSRPPRRAAKSLARTSARLLLESLVMKSSTLVALLLSSLAGCSLESTSGDDAETSSSNLGTDATSQSSEGVIMIRRLALFAVVSALAATRRGGSSANAGDDVDVAIAKTAANQRARAAIRRLIP
jgi:hypothetical protein